MSDHMDLQRNRTSFSGPKKPKQNVIVLATAALLLCVSSTTGCVSVSLKTPGKIAKAEGVRFRSPASPFSSMTTSDADRAWQNKENGNSIAYHSSCNDPSDPSIESVQAEVLSAFEDVKVVRTGDKEVNGRVGLDAEATGIVDGVKMQTQIIIFKKNNCVYTLSYVGIATSFAQNQKQFLDFVSSFEAP